MKVIAAIVRCGSAARGAAVRHIAVLLHATKGDTSTRARKPSEIIDPENHRIVYASTSGAGIYMTPEAVG